MEMTDSAAEEKPDTVVTFNTPPGHNRRTSKLRHRRRMKDVTQVVMKMNSRRNLFDEGASQDNESHLSGVSSIRSGPNHRRSITDILPYQDNSAYEESPLADASIPMYTETQDTALSFLDHAQHLENLFQQGPADSYADLGNFLRPVTEGDNEDGSEMRLDGNSAGGDVEEGAAKETTNLLPAAPKFFKRRNRCWAAFIAILPPGFSLWKAIYEFLSTTFLFFMVPCMLAAWMFYVPLGNPDMEVLPARVAWFFLFAVRLSVTFTLAQISQWIMIVLLRTPIFVRLAGPLIALGIMQSMGWPLFISNWGIWNIVLLQGDSPYVQHWFFGTGIQFKRGDAILASDFYKHVLVSMIVVGVAVGIKRTFVALYLSRRMLQYYRFQMEDMMNQIKMIMEVADLAAQSEKPEFDEMVKENFSQIARERNKFVEIVPTLDNSKKIAKKGSKDKLGGGGDDTDGDSSSSDGGDDDGKSLEDADQDLDHAMDLKPPQSNSDVDPKEIWNSLKERAMNDRDTYNFAGDDTSNQPRPSRRLGHHRSGNTSINNQTNQIFPFLERWHEPKETGKKNEAPNLTDILQFKKAMSFMEEKFIFGLAYGPCGNRKACVKNAVKVYRKLLKFTPGQPMLNFDVIAALAYEDDGTIDEEQAVALLRIFFPDKDNCLPMLAFVQACDNVYKQMRFLRASISNSTKIDAVLEDSFDAVFYVTLAIVVLSLCGFNPWPLLVSMSTLMVSFAFAFGPSVAKNIEGMLMIAVRRPYDIGDRITITDATAVANTTQKDTWLVEDITLSTTTLRYASTNEVANINNASVANARIVNLARSSKAMVTIQYKFDVDASQRQLDEFRYAMERYLENRPRNWISLVHYRPIDIDSDLGFVTMMYRAQHVKPWQELGAVMIDRGEWERHADNTAREMNISFSLPPKQHTVGLGIAPDSKGSAAIDDRKQVADFIRIITCTGDKNQSTGSSDPVRDAVSEYHDAGEPHPLLSHPNAAKEEGKSD